jgi:hypothetical protein
MNCMTTRLFNKCFEKYESFPDSQKGGLLLFIIMMNHLISDSEDAVACLKKMDTTMKIRDQPGESVPKVISLILGAYKHLKFLKRVPENFTSQVLQVLQTSSVDKFNNYFLSVEHNHRYDYDMAKTRNPSFNRKTYKREAADVEAILEMAEKLYNKLCASNTWSGAKTKGKAAAFVGTGNANSVNTGRRKLICWNCGEEGHPSQECPKPRNQQMYNSNRKKFNEQRNKNKKNNNKSTTPAAPKPAGTHNSPHKFRPAEDGENNRRVIDGKHMYYNKRTGQWVLDTSHHTNKGNNPPTSHAANVCQPATTTAPAQAAPRPDQAALNAALANTSRAIDTALRGLMTQFTA